MKLNTNESPFPPAPGVLKVVNEAEAKNLRLYSDPELKPLKAAIAETFLWSRQMYSLAMDRMSV